MERAQAVPLHGDKASSVVTAEERTSHEDDNYLSAGEEDEERSDATASLHEDRTSPITCSEDDNRPPENTPPPLQDELIVGNRGFSTVKHQESRLEEDRASPPTVNENKPDSTSNNSNEIIHSEKLVSHETQGSGAENGDDNEFSTLAKSKSMNPADARVENGGMKIFARRSSDDDLASSPPPHHRRCFSVDLVAKVPPNYIPKPSNSPQTSEKVQIETEAPIKSVKAAVSKFGGIVDWKAHRVHSVERRKFIEQELDKAQEELPVCRQQCEAANEARIQAQKQLESTKRLIEELKLNLERAQTEEQQAKQDSELAKLRVEELEQGIADDDSFAAKAQLEVAKARHAAAVSELKSVRDEIEQIRIDYDLLLAEKEAAERKSEEAMLSSKEIEKVVESLTIELITLKQSLDSAHSAHLEAEEHRIGAVMAKEQDNLNWEVELKQAEEELEKLNQQVIATNDLKSKLAEATTMLQKLKGELAAYMESKPDAEEETLEDPLEEPEKKTRAEIEAAINAAKREFQQVKDKIEKATKEVNILKVASASLRSQLEKENTELDAVKQREDTASTLAVSLEEELSKIKSEIIDIQKKEEEERAKLVELPLQLEKASQEAEQARELSRIAGEELEKAKQEADNAKAIANEKQSKLREIEREIEAAKASERLAIAAITALKVSESSQKNVNNDASFDISLSLEEYYELSKRAHEAEEQANARVAVAMSQLQMAKEVEKKSEERLEEVSNEMSRRRDALEAALNKAELAAERKTSIEQDLRKWRGDHDHKRRGSKDDAKSQRSPKSSKEGKKKKKSFLPKFFMFIGKNKKSHSSKPEGS